MCRSDTLSDTRRIASLPSASQRQLSEPYRNSDVGLVGSSVDGKPGEGTNQVNQTLKGHYMAINHADPGEVVNIRPLKEKIAESKTTTLLKTDRMEVLRLVMPEGKKIAEHKAPGEITVQCLEGRVKFTSQGQPKELVAGDLLYLSAAEPHAVEAIEDSSVLVTILLGRPSSREGD